VGYFQGRTIRVTGIVKLYRDKPEIVVEDPKQVEVLEKSKQP
jgi:DNA/RNA endonuclease YhcR with UshA esterase domain